MLARWSLCFLFHVLFVHGVPMSVVKIPPNFYVHIEDLNSCTVRLETGPKNLTLLINERLVEGTISILDFLLKTLLPSLSLSVFRFLNLFRSDPNDYYSCWTLLLHFKSSYSLRKFFFFVLFFYLLILLCSFSCFFPQSFTSFLAFFFVLFFASSHFNLAFFLFFSSELFFFFVLFFSFLICYFLSLPFGFSHIYLEGKPVLDQHGQAKLKFGDQEVRKKNKLRKELKKQNRKRNIQKGACLGFFFSLFLKFSVFSFFILFSQSFFSSCSFYFALSVCF